MAIILPERICYFQLKPEDVLEIVKTTLVDRELVDRLLFEDESTGKKIAHQHDIPFYKPQEQILLGDNVYIDPRNIEDYIARGGYASLAKGLFDMTPESVLKTVKDSDLRGRGGGGFPAGIKWETTRNAPGEPKYVIVNADEGDPGAYMDQGLLEGKENVRLAIEQAEKLGLLGKNILGSGFDFEVTIHQGAGAFVSGESSALMTAIEGMVGEPRPKYIRTAVKGIWDRPSNLNNVETYANVPLIIDKGASWYRKMGTDGSKGTKIFSLVGKVKYTGLVEVPMGLSLRQIIFDILAAASLNRI
jgi:NADH-quinone oxidoreductase subunit F